MANEKSEMNDTPFYFYVTSRLPNLSGSGESQIAAEKMLKDNLEKFRDSELPKIIAKLDKHIREHASESEWQD